MNPTKHKLEKWVSQLMYGNPPTVEQQRWWNKYKNSTKQPIPKGGDDSNRSVSLVQSNTNANTD